MAGTGTFTMNLTTKKGRFTDTTDYAALGMDLSVLANLNAKGLGTITAQGDIIVQKLTTGDPLIDLASGDTYVEFDLVLDTSGEVAQINYTVDYSLRLNATEELITNITAPSTFDTDTTVDYSTFFEAGNALELVVIGDSPTQDVTIVSFSDVSPSPNLQIVVEETIDDAYDAMNFDITNQWVTGSWTFAGCTLIEACAAFVYDCQYGDFGTWSVTNTTPITDQTLVSLEATITWPPLTGLSPIEVTSLPYTNNTLAIGTYSINMTEVLQQTQTDGLIIEYTTTYATEFAPVVCTTSGDLCGLMTCFNKLLEAHLAAIASSKLSPYQASYDSAVGYLQEYNVYNSCGETAKASTALGKLQLVLDSFGCDCGCGSSNESGSIWVQNTATVMAPASQVSYTAPDDQDLITGVTNVKEALDAIIENLVTLNP